MRTWLALALWIAVTFLAATAGAIAPPDGWYAQLVKPSWNPPSWVFGPVWTTLYLMMAVAAWLVWKETGWQRGRRPLGLYLAQLVLNFFWTIVFFGLHRPGAALVEIAVLWVLIVLTAMAFFRVRRLAGALLVPYLAWVSFASVLNFELWRLNRG